ncbi:MAG: uroporphyrinogen decarboxylase [Chloroflexota bacterium]
MPPPSPQAGARAPRLTLEESSNQARAPLLEALRGRPVEHTPIWFMRQAGRSLPEYRAVKQHHSLLDICREPELCAEVTLQPVRRLGVDAAILYADITLPLVEAGVGLDLVEGIGPVTSSTVRTMEDALSLPQFEPMPLQAETIRLVRSELPPEIPLLGFAGAPFTLATYLIEGRPSRDFRHTKLLMYGEPDVWAAIMSRLTDMTINYLRGQIDAGVQAIQLFDSWAGALSLNDYRRYVLPYSRQVFGAITDVPTIHFATGAGALLRAMAEAGGDAVGVDWRLPIDSAWHDAGSRAIQGNLDPLTLLGPWAQVKAEAADILARVGGRPGHVFNLGHGVHPETSPDQLARLAEFVHAG